MGGILSYLVGSVQEEGDGQAEASLLDLLDPDHFGANENSQVIWNAMRQRLQTHPEEAAAYARSIDSSPLYRAMELAQSRNTTLPADLVRLFLDSYEESAYDTPSSGETLLFLAAYGASLRVEDNIDDDSLEIIKLLMQFNPEAASQSTSQSRLLPVHHVRGNPGIAEVLLSAYPQGALSQDAAGRLPLHHCCSGDHVRGIASQQHENDNNEEPGEEEEQEDAERDTNATSPRLALTHPEVVSGLIQAAEQHELKDGGVLMQDRESKTPLDLLCEEICGELNDNESSDSSSRVARLWKSLVIMVHAVPQEDETFRMVHAVIALNCSPAIVAHALTLYPEQAGQRDSKGCTPLMLAALSLDTVHPAVICTLLQFYPEAACMTDVDGRLPIDIIAESSKYDEELWEALVKAEPRAVDTRDLRDKMFPFMTAAIGDKSNMNSVYRLLRAKPHVLSYFNLE